ncbi:MAG: efflux RND transporter periplasmic adaptor subunit [Calditrichaeota bacterium]|nr:MAG: efflux RND transporter periplasmic adaptor subunit [Calditrichota bacterium]
MNRTARSFRLKPLLAPALILIFGILAMYVLASLRTEPPKRTPLPKVRLVETTVVHYDTLTARVVGYGRLTSAQPVNLVSEVSGTVQAGEVPFQPGQSFRRGQVLLRIDDRQTRLNLNSAKSDLLNALANVLPEIKVDFPEQYPRWQEYFDRCDFDTPLPPLPEVADSKLKLFLSRFNIYKLYFAVRNLEIRLEKHRILAPFDGAILSADVRPGTPVINGARLGQIINLENLEVEVPVPTADIAWIERRRPVILSAEGLPETWAGVIRRVGKAIDPKTQTVPVYIGVSANPGRDLFQGLFLRADFSGRTVPHGMRIPREALYQEQYVYLIKQGRLAYRKVEIARRELNSVIITGGVAPGDTLVTEVLQGVTPGMLARPRSTAVLERGK